MSNDVPQPSPQRPPSQARRDLLWGAGFFLAFIAFSAVILLIFNPAPKSAAIKPNQVPKGKDILALTVVHTNDTWGYLSVCGS